MRSTCCHALTSLSWTPSFLNCLGDCVSVPLNHHVLWKPQSPVSSSQNAKRSFKSLPSICMDYAYFSNSLNQPCYVLTFKINVRTTCIFSSFLYLYHIVRWRACGGSQRPAGEWTGPQLPQAHMEPGHRRCDRISPPGHTPQFQGAPPFHSAEAGELAAE